MSNPLIIVIDGRADVWSELACVRCEDLRAMAKARQLTLIELKEDAQPASHRTAADRFLEPSLFAGLENG